MTHVELPAVFRKIAYIMATGRIFLWTPGGINRQFLGIAHWFGGIIHWIWKLSTRFEGLSGYFWGNPLISGIGKTQIHRFSGACGKFRQIPRGMSRISRGTSREGPLEYTRGISRYPRRRRRGNFPRARAAFLRNLPGKAAIPRRLAANSPGISPDRSLPGRGWPIWGNSPFAGC